MCYFEACSQSVQHMLLGMAEDNVRHDNLADWYFVLMEASRGRCKAAHNEPNSAILSSQQTCSRQDKEHAV